MNVEAQRWSCFAGCGYGDIYELVKLAEGIDRFPECKDVAEKRFGAETLSRSATGKHGSRRPKRKGKAWM